MKTTKTKRTSKSRDCYCQSPKGCDNDATYEVMVKTRSTLKNMLLCDYCIGPYVDLKEGPDFKMKKLPKERLTYGIQDEALH